MKIFLHNVAHKWGKQFTCHAGIHQITIYSMPPRQVRPCDGRGESTPTAGDRSDTATDGASGRSGHGLGQSLAADVPHGDVLLPLGRGTREERGGGREDRQEEEAERLIPR